MRIYKELVKRYPKLDKKDQEAPGAGLAGAHAAFELLDPEFTAYKRMKITLNKKTLQKKAAKATELACISSGPAKCKKEGKFLSILTYKNGDFAIAALTRIGMVFRDMANSIRHAPLPRRLSEDQLEIYRAELDNVALGPEEKALQAFEMALDKAYELNIYNDWTLLAQDNLKSLNPNKFPDPQQIGFRGAEGFFLATADTSAASASDEVEEEEEETEEVEDDGDEQAAAGDEAATGATN